MDIHQQRTVIQMSTAVADLQRAHSDARRLIELEADRSGVRSAEALPVVARREGVAPGTIENILRGRVKAVAGWVRDRLRAAVIRELQAEIGRLEHELAVARLGAARPSDDEVFAAEAALAQARKLLSGSAQP